MGHACRELKRDIGSNYLSRKEGPNVWGCSSDENVVPESTDDAAGAKSPGAVPAREENDCDIDQSLKRVQEAE